MATTDLSLFDCKSLRDVVSTDVDLESPITGDPTRDDKTREKWQRLIDQLLEWQSAPSQLDDEGVDPPSGETIRRAIVLLQALRNGQEAVPDSVVPDPNGGIVVERREKDVSEVFYVWDNGTVEYCRFQEARLVERRPY